MWSTPKPVRFSATSSSLNEVGHPLWEVLDAHPNGFEWVFVLHDSGYGAIMLVPDGPDTDAELMKLCRSYAARHVGLTADVHAMASVEECRRQSKRTA